MAIPSVEMNATNQERSVDSHLATLLPALRRLDRVLDWAVKGAESAGGPDTSTRFRGLYITPEQVAGLLSQDPGSVPLGLAQKSTGEYPEEISPANSPLAWFVQAFGLSNFDADAIILALAPEIDLRYEKIYSYLQDDVTRKRPTMELALNLLCSSAEEKLSRRAHFSLRAPLIRENLLYLVPDPNQVEPPTLAHYLKLDEQVVQVLLGQAGLDARLTPFCELVEPAFDWDQLPLSSEIKHTLPRLVVQARSVHDPVRFYFEGPRGPEKRRAAETVAKLAGTKLLVARLDRLPDEPSIDRLGQLLLREAQLHGATLYLSELDALRGQDAAARRQDLLDLLAVRSGITILSGQTPWVPASGSSFGVLSFAFGIPEFEDRCRCWRAELEKRCVEIGTKDVETISARFRVTPLQISQAVDAALLSSQWRTATAASDDATASPARATPSLDELSAAARSQCGHELNGLARKIAPRYTWADIVLPADQIAHLREICRQAEYRHVVYGQWGFDRKLSLGKGLNVLFCGPPGTGKTMAAEVIACELRLDLYRIDLSQVVSKYIGETEKNLDRIFAAAENSNAILLFDEADALFGKRSVVRDSHDRYANIEISFLLQKMEEYQGISILATNLRQNLDEAFERRLHAVVEFPFPDEEYRRRIWESVFPAEAPLAEDVRFDLLAREVRLAGGNIKNMALAAAFYAAAESGVIRMSHLIQAAYREHQKLARCWSAGELSKARAATS